VQFRDHDEREGIQRAASTSLLLISELPKKLERVHRLTAIQIGDAFLDCGFQLGIVYDVDLFLFLHQRFHHAYRTSVAQKWRSEPGRAAGGVPDRQHFDRVVGHAVVDVVADSFGKNASRSTAAAVAALDTVEGLLNDMAEGFLDIVVECGRGFIPIAAPPAAR
jgi:hypothetical protein